MSGTEDREDERMRGQSQRNNETGVTRRTFLLNAAVVGAAVISGHPASSSGQNPSAENGGAAITHSRVKDTVYDAAVLQTVLHGFSDAQPDSERIRKNIQVISDLVRQVITTSTAQLRLIVLPVLSFTGIGDAQFKFGVKEAFKIEEVAIDLTGDPRLDPLRKLCAEFQCYLASTCVEKVKELPGRYFHTGFVIGPDGLVLRSPKLQAATSTGITLLQDFYTEYSKQFGADALFPVAETQIGRLGCVVANDFLVPEASRMLRKKGAEIIVHPTAEQEGPKHPPYMALRQSQAYTNGVYWLSAAPSRETITTQGKQLEARYGGGSSIIGPDGAIAAVMKGREEGQVTARIDLKFLRSCRELQDKHTTPAQMLYRDRYL